MPPTRARHLTFSASSSLALAACVPLLAGLALGGCNPFRVCAFSDSAAPGSGARESGGSSGAMPAAPPSGTAAPTSADATRAVAEADIVQLDATRNWLYTVSRSGWLSVIDASQPRVLSLLGGTGLRGVPFEMYRRDGALLVLSNQAVLGDGTLGTPLPQGAAAPAPTSTAGALLQVMDLADPANPKTLGTLRLPGEIADSRIVGDVLYVATYENAACWSCAVRPRTVVTSFDVAQPASPRQIDQVTYDSEGTYGNVTTTTTPWKRSLVATPTRLYVGGLADAASPSEGVIEVLDIGDPGGKLVRGAKIAVDGPVLSRWQMDEHEGTLRVVSQRGAARNVNGERFPEVETFRVASASSVALLGRTTLSLPRQEGLKSVRFDGKRAYAITFETVTNRDPLFTIDLSNPAVPVQRGSLAMPGWVFHIVPKGDRLIGLGLDRTSTQGQLNLSLFDVSNLDAPTMVQRVDFGPNGIWNDASLTNGVLAEDQDRIQKAFRVFDDGLITVPYSDPGYGGGDACTSGRSGVQLLSWSGTGIRQHALLPVGGNPRRALRRDSESSKELLAISDSAVVAFDIARRDVALPTASVKIGECVARPWTLPTAPNDLMPVGDGRDHAYGGDDTGSRCE